MKMIQAYLDHSAVGCGQRRFFVLSEGRKWTTLFCPSSLRRFRIHPEKLFRVEEVPVNKPLIRKLLRKKAKDFRRWERRFPRKLVNTLIEELSA